MTFGTEAGGHRPEQILEHGRRAMAVGIGQVGFARFAADAEMDELAEAAGQSIANLA